VRDKLIVSLVPAATEIVVAVGGGEQLVGVSHECDWPERVRSLPRVTTTPIDPGRPSAAIHLAVRDAVAAGRSVIGIDAATLRALQPDVIITQQLCDVCAVADGEVHQLAAVLERTPDVVVLSGTTLAGVWNDVRQVGTAIGREAEANVVALRLAEQVAVVAAKAPARRPRVVAIEWIDPLFLAGHWVPEMIHAAGGVDVGAVPGSHSVVHSWDAVMALEPEVVFVALCGFDETRARAELASLRDQRLLDWLAVRPVIVLDGNAYTSRPGPRLVSGIRLMQDALSRC
jgi:iron complex transport system substrate-binding protein